MGTRWYTLPANYIYISHLGDDGKYFILPNFPDSIQDSLNSNFGSQNALSRSAPVFTYINSGPRQMQVTLRLHRDLMESVNKGVATVEVELGDDYLDTLIKALQAIAVPKYNLSNKAIEPPLVALRLSNEVFIKGIVNGPIALTYALPLLSNGKYAEIHLSITVTEVDPYDAELVKQVGSFRYSGDIPLKTTLSSPSYKTGRYWWIYCQMKHINNIRICQDIH